MLTAILTGCFLALWSFLFAAIEIAIEGPVGWALAAPTWRKRSRLYGALMGGKELTGYHLWMFFLPFLLLHLPFVFAAHWGIGLWSLARECEILGCYFLLCVHWDFQWFVLNPHFGTRRFRPGEIWWHAKWVWRIPVDYLFASSLAIVLAGAAYVLGGTGAWLRLTIVADVLIAALVVSWLFAARFHEWYGQLCWKHVLATDDWLAHLPWDEVRRLKQLLVGIDEARAEIARLGRRRAQREQLGVTVDVPAAAPLDGNRGRN